MNLRIPRVQLNLHQIARKAQYSQQCRRLHCRLGKASSPVSLSLSVLYNSVSSHGLILNGHCLSLVARCENVNKHHDDEDLTSALS